MAKWFPDVSEPEGVSEALKAGIFGALAFAGMNLIGIFLLLVSDQMPSTGDVVDQQGWAILGILIEMSFGLIAAWRFKKQKGLFWGIFVTGIFVLEVFVKISSGTTNVGWMIAYAAIFAALINGIRGAWSARAGGLAEDDALAL